MTVWTLLITEQKEDKADGMGSMRACVDKVPTKSEIHPVRFAMLT